MILREGCPANLPALRQENQPDNLKSGKFFATLRFTIKVTEGGRGVGASERRMAIWHTLCTKRRVTIAYLAEKYSMSARTIRYDIEVLSRSYPIETRAGKNGGVQLAEWFHPGGSAIHQEQIDLLLRIHQQLEGNDAAIIEDIIILLNEK